MIYFNISLMIKIFPIILIPSIFIVIFLHVKNLTQSDTQNLNINDPQINFDVNSVQTVDEASKKEKKEILNKKRLDPPLTLSDNSIAKGEGKDTLVENIKESKSKIVVDEESKKSEIVQQDNIQKKKVVKKEVSQSSNQIKPTLIQLGAFSKLNNAEKHKEFLSIQMSREFSNFDKKLKIVEDNKLFKIIFTSDSLKIAKKICKFSKSLKIGCLILKK